MDLAIESLSAGRRTCSHMEAGIKAMLNIEMNIEHMEVKKLHETKGEMPLQVQEVHWFWLPVTTT